MYEAPKTFLHSMSVDAAAEQISDCTEIDPDFLTYELRERCGFEVDGTLWIGTGNERVDVYAIH